MVITRTSSPARGGVLTPLHKAGRAGLAGAGRLYPLPDGRKFILCHRAVIELGGAVCKGDGQRHNKDAEDGQLLRAVRSAAAESVTIRIMAVTRSPRMGVRRRHAVDYSITRSVYHSFPLCKVDEGSIRKRAPRGRILAKMTAWKANNHTVGAGYSQWPFVGKRRADMESDPTEDVILEEAINKGRGGAGGGRHYMPPLLSISFLAMQYPHTARQGGSSPTPQCPIALWPYPGQAAGRIRACG